MSDYGFVHDGRTFTPNGTPNIDPADNDARNAEIERAELAYWQTRPERMIAYFKFPAERCSTPRQYRAAYQPDLVNATVSVWLGTVIGHIISARVYSHNFGHRFVSIRVKGTNGAEYYGRASYDWGSVIRLRRVKS